MPPKVSKVSSKPTQTKTIAKASTSSSSKSSGSSKTSSSSGVKKSAPPVTSKPKNVDKVDFGKPKPTASAGVYKPAPPPKSIAAAKHEDPITEIHNKKMRELEDKMFSPAGKKIRQNLRDLEEKKPRGPMIPNTKIVAPPKPKPADDPSKQDYDPMIMQPSQRQTAREIIHEEAVKASENKAAQHAVRATATEAAGRVGGAPARIAVGAASFTETGEKIVKKTVEIINEALGILGENYTFEDMP